MSVCYWALSGYGIELDIFDLDSKSVCELMGIIIEDPDGLPCYDEVFNDFDLQDIIIEMCTKSSCGLDYGDTGNNNLGTFLMLHAGMPWEWPATASYTQLQVEDDIVAVLLPYLNKKHDEQWIRDNITRISLGGEG